MAAAQVFTIEDKDLDERAFGRFVFWSLSGDVKRAVLAAKLTEFEAGVESPDEPSNIVALHRACEFVARAEKAEAQQPKRGQWLIVAKPQTDEEKKKLTYDINVSAHVDKETKAVIVEGNEALKARVLERYEIEKGMLAPADISYWLCKRLEKMAAVGMKSSGGLYFVPKPSVESWLKITGALKKASRHDIHAIPAMRGADAVEAILSAITTDTREACEKISEELKGITTQRGLETKEGVARGLVERVEKYEELLGMKLTELRDAVENASAAIAAASMTLSAKEGDD